MKLKPGVSVQYRKKKYVDEIPDALFSEIYGKDTDKMKEKLELKESKKKLVKDEPKKSSD